LAVNRWIDKLIGGKSKAMAWLAAGPCGKTAQQSDAFQAEAASP
jgi:hypothetical protein